MRNSRIWRIEGILTTVTPLHIGDGDITKHDKLKDIEITSVVKDIDDRAYIPGTSLKGNIRSWLKRESCVPCNVLEELFGSEDSQKEDALGGKAEFWNAYALPEQSISSNSPYWEQKRLIDVMVSVSIDRSKRTAIKEKLFHYEFVPPGVKFLLTIIIPYAGEDEVIPLIYALEHGFSDDDPIIIGASSSNDWGKLNWKLNCISKIDPEDVRKWICDNSADKACDFVPLQEDEIETLLNKANELKINSSSKTEKINIKLKFKGPFLVNDPSQVEKNETDKTENKGPDHIPRRNYENKVVLPASSFRGAFRSQAERIIRTLGGYACDPSDPCNPKEKLCLACQIFGATGQKSLISFTDFVQCNEEENIRQEFVAIDRFTGGGAKSFKFSADAIIDPELEGTMAISEKLKCWEIGLLALTLRDLQDGDITFGFGSSKGYGKCEAETNFFVKENEERINKCVKEFREFVQKKGEGNV